VLYGVPNPNVLLSSRIEGTQTTLGEVLKFEAGEEIEEQSRRQDIYEIISYRRTLQIAEEELERRPFNLSLLLRLHEVLLNSVRGKYARRTHAGIAIR
jgi:Fic family protein